MRYIWVVLIFICEGQEDIWVRWSWNSNSGINSTWLNSTGSLALPSIQLLSDDISGLFHHSTSLHKTFTLAGVNRNQVCIEFSFWSFGRWPRDLETYIYFNNVNLWTTNTDFPLADDLRSCSDTQYSNPSDLTIHQSQMFSNLTWDDSMDPSDVIQCRWDVRSLCVNFIGENVDILVDVESPISEYFHSVYYAFDNFKITLYPDEVLFDMKDASPFGSNRFKIPSSYFFDAYAFGPPSYIDVQNEDPYFTLDGENDFIILSSFDDYVSNLEDEFSFELVFTIRELNSVATLFHVCSSNGDLKLNFDFNDSNQIMFVYESPSANREVVYSLQQNFKYYVAVSASVSQSIFRIFLNSELILESTPASIESPSEVVSGDRASFYIGCDSQIQNLASIDVFRFQVTNYLLDKATADLHYRSLCPTLQPSASPSSNPTPEFTVSPTYGPSLTPTSSMPSTSPSGSPSTSPSKSPTSTPTSTIPTAHPTLGPTVSAPTDFPTSSTPTGFPSTIHPSTSPSGSPSQSPSVAPSKLPTRDPSPDWVGTVSAQYDVSFEYILVVFHCETDRSGEYSSFDCNSILDPISTDALDPIICIWESNSKLRIYTGSQASLRVFEDISFGVQSPKKIYLESLDFKFEGQLPLLPQLTPSLDFFLAAPTEIGPCVPLILSSTYETGSAGRVLTYEWQIMPQLQPCASGLDSSEITISDREGNCFTENFRFNFCLTVRNWLEESVQKCVTVNFVMTNPPISSQIISPPQIYHDPGKFLHLDLIHAVKYTCPTMEIDTSANWQYMWSSTGAQRYYIANVNGPDLSIPAYDLQPNKNYTFAFSAWEKISDFSVGGIVEVRTDGTSLRTAPSIVEAVSYGLQEHTIVHFAQNTDMGGLSDTFACNLLISNAFSDSRCHWSDARSLVLDTVDLSDLVFPGLLDIHKEGGSHPLVITEPVMSSTSLAPTNHPSGSPSTSPSNGPSRSPSHLPSCSPSFRPSKAPSTTLPSHHPSLSPTHAPIPATTMNPEHPNLRCHGHELEVHTFSCFAYLDGSPCALGGDYYCDKRLVHGSLVACARCAPTTTTELPLVAASASLLMSLTFIIPLLFI